MHELTSVMHISCPSWCQNNTRKGAGFMKIRVSYSCQSIAQAIHHHNKDISNLLAPLLSFVEICEPPSFSRIWRVWKRRGSRSCTHLLTKRLAMVLDGGGLMLVSNLLPVSELHSQLPYFFQLSLHVIRISSIIACFFFFYILKRDN